MTVRYGLAGTGRVRHILIDIDSGKSLCGEWPCCFPWGYREGHFPVCKRCLKKQSAPPAEAADDLAGCTCNGDGSHCEKHQALAAGEGAAS